MNQNETEKNGEAKNCVQVAFDILVICCIVLMILSWVPWRFDFYFGTDILTGDNYENIRRSVSFAPLYTTIQMTLFGFFCFKVKKKVCWYISLALHICELPAAIFSYFRSISLVVMVLPGEKSKTIIRYPVLAADLILWLVILIMIICIISNNDILKIEKADSEEKVKKK